MIPVKYTRFTRDSTISLFLHILSVLLSMLDKFISYVSKLKISSCDGFHDELAPLLAFQRYIKELRSPAAIDAGEKFGILGFLVLGIGFDRQRRSDPGT